MGLTRQTTWAKAALSDNIPHIALDAAIDDSVSPGSHLVVDKILSFTEDGPSDSSMAPHISAEESMSDFKGLCDGKTGIMMRIELNEGPARMVLKEHCAQYGPAAACAVRLAKPWRDTGRVVIGASSVASVKTADALSLLNLFFIVIFLQLDNAAVSK